VLSPAILAPEINTCVSFFDFIYLRFSLVKKRSSRTLENGNKE
jgi:hypothetical protein